VAKSDVRIRAIEWSRRRRSSLRIVWFVVNRVEDMALFNVLITSSGDNQLVVNETVEYNVREYVANGLSDRQEYVVCVNTMDSEGRKRRQLYSQCIQFDGNNVNIENYAPQMSLSTRPQPQGKVISFANRLSLSGNHYVILVIICYLFL